MTVPVRFRKNSATPPILVLHYCDLADGDIEAAAGFCYMRPLRTILDTITAGEVERSTITQAVRQAIQRGLITKSHIRSTPMSDTARKLIGGALNRVA
jgi:hypothetical protein